MVVLRALFGHKTRPVPRLSGLPLNYKDTVMTQPSLSTRFTPRLMMLLVLFALTVQGCFHSSSGGSGSTGPTNATPVFTSSTAISVGAGITATGYTATVTDADDNDTVTFSLSGGADETAFSIDSDSGVLSFTITTDLDVPADSDGNNSYVVDITATDGTASVVQTVTVTVIDDADPAGYYTNTGAASVGDGMSGTINISDLQAMVNSDRIMMMSVANGLLYDGTITKINGNDFTVDFTIYTDGENLVNATGSGTITEGSTIEGTLVGSGVGSGTFSLLYATTNDEVANLSRIENVASVNATWMALLANAVIEQEFIINNMGAITHDTSGVPGIFSSCAFDGTITPITDSSLYDVAATLTSCITGGGLANGTYTGLATSRTDSAQDDTLVFAITNGIYSPNADFE